LFWLWGGVYWEWRRGATEVGLFGSMGSCANCSSADLVFWGVMLWCWGGGVELIWAVKGVLGWLLDVGLLGFVGWVAVTFVLWGGGTIVGLGFGGGAK